MDNNYGDYKQQGFTMIEVLLALVIGLFVMAGFIGLYYTASGAFESGVSSAEAQYSARRVANDIVKDIKQSSSVKVMNNNELVLNEGTNEQVIYRLSNGNLFRVYKGGTVPIAEKVRSINYSLPATGMGLVEITIEAEQNNQLYTLKTSAKPRIEGSKVIIATNPGDEEDPGNGEDPTDPPEDKPIINIDDIRDNPDWIQFHKDRKDNKPNDYQYNESTSSYLIDSKLLVINNDKTTLLQNKYGTGKYKVDKFFLDAEPHETVWIDHPQISNSNFYLEFISPALIIVQLDQEPTIEEMNRMKIFSPQGVVYIVGNEEPKPWLGILNSVES